MAPTEASPDQSKIHGLHSKFMSHVKQFFGVISSGYFVGKVGADTNPQSIADFQFMAANQT